MQKILIKLPCVVYDEASHKYKTVRIEFDAEPRLLVIPGWKKGVEIFVHRSVNDKKTWTVTDGATLQQISTPICKTRKHAIDSAIENLAKYGEYYYRYTTVMGLADIEEK